MVQGSDLLTGNVVTKRSVSGKSIRARLNSDQEVQPHVSSGAIPQKIPTGEDYGAGVGRAISGLGNVFGNVLAKIGAQEEKNKFANARLDFENADREIRDNIRKNPDLVDGAPQLYDQTRSSIIKKYGFEKDPDKELYFTQRANTRVHHYADIKQKRAVEGFIANENSSIDKAVNAIVADPTPETRDRVLSSLDELVENSVGSYRTRAQALERKQELKDHLSLKYIEKLKETDPDKAEAELKAFKEGRISTSVDDKKPVGKSVLSYSRNLDQLVPADRKDGRTADINNLKPEVKTKLQQLQQSIGKNLIINSGFRDPAHNKKVGGAKKSRHMHGDAIDLQWPKNASIEEKQNIIATAKSLGFTGFGIGNGILHLDTGRPRFWGYSNGKPTGNVPLWSLDALTGKIKPSNKKGNDSVQIKIAQAAEEAGIDPDYMVRLAGAESSYRPGVKADTSSATGLFQITKGTADRLGRSHGKKSVEEEIADGIAITKANQETLKNYLGRAPRNDELHLAHVFGAGRANGIINAKNETPIDKVLPPNVIKANSKGIFKTVKTVGQLKAWAKAKQNAEVKVAGSLQRAPVQTKRSKFVDKEITRLEKSIAKAVEQKQERVVKDALKGKPALVQQQMIDQLAEKSRTEPGNKQLEQQLEFAKKAKKKFDTAIKNDPLDVGESHGIAEVKPLIQEGKAPVETLNERRVAANKIAEVYQIKPRFLRPDEAVQFKQRFDMLETSDQLAQLAAFEHGFKGDATKVISEFSKQDVGFAHVGGLFLKGRRDVAARALIGMKAMNDKANKIMVENLNKVDTRTAITNVFGNLFPNLDKGLHKGFLVAGQALAFEALMTGKETDPQTALENGLRAASGEKIVDGGLFGFDEQWGGIAEFNGQKFLVPTDMKADDAEDAFEFITSNMSDAIDIFKKTGGTVPINPETREAVTAEDLNGAKFVSVEMGRYKIVLESGYTLRHPKPQHVESDGIEFYGAFVFDLNGALEAIKLIKDSRPKANHRGDELVTKRKNGE